MTLRELIDLGWVFTVIPGPDDQIAVEARKTINGKPHRNAVCTKENVKLIDESCKWATMWEQKQNPKPNS